MNGRGGCRERLQQHWEHVPAGNRDAAEKILRDAGAREPLLRDGRIESGLHANSTPPLCTPRRVSMSDKLVRFITGTHWHTPKRVRA